MSAKPSELVDVWTLNSRSQENITKNEPEPKRNSEQVLTVQESQKDFKQAQQSILNAYPF